MSWCFAIDQPMAKSSGRQSAGLEINMRPVGVRGRLWRVVEWSCTKMESGNVFYTPDLLLGSLRDVMGLRF